MIAQSVLHHARQTPEKYALLTSRRHWTYGDLGRGISHALACLRAVVPPGKAVAVSMSNDGEAVACVLAAELLGNPAVLLGSGLRTHELTWAMTVGGVHALLGAPPPYIEDGTAAILSGREVVNEGGFRVLTLIPTSDRGGWVEDAFFSQMTSGSTGASHLAIRTRRGIKLEIDAVASRLGLTDADTVLCASSIGHSYALIGGILGTLHVGGTVMLPPYPRNRERVGHTPHPTILFGIARTYKGLLEDGRHAEWYLRDNRWLLSAGAPLPAGVFDRFMSRYGRPIRQDYGTTETGTISIDTSEDVNPASVGAPLPHMDVSFPSTGGQREILIRSEAVSPGYLSDDGLVACTDGDGWYHTGDVGKSIDGQLFLTGRRHRETVIEGHRVDLQDLEHLLLQVEGINAAAVVQGLGVGGHTTLKAFVASSDADRHAVEERVREDLSRWDFPIALEFRDVLPMSPAGKVLRKYLM